MFFSADVTQKFTTEGDVGILFVYAVFEDGFIMDISNEEFLKIEVDNKNLEFNKSKSGVYEVQVPTGGESKIGRFLFVELLNCVDQSISPIASPLINITLDNALSATASSTCFENTLTYEGDLTTEFLNTPTSCSLTIMLNFPGNFLSISPFESSCVFQKDSDYLLCMNNVFSEF